VLVVRGKAGAVQKIADALIATKGVKHGRLTITTSGAALK
jgi:CopG family nickel-responsive transcriptional regulator